ncbi:MAG: hypothetical protein GF383_11800 [Candidatus Lokiarchaeota archaeon]|nr:hypothetical protein [Candidatus Lokiarchaeota archaeon]MBD3341529.1 hypothetical protein [Candidatus Lokiarchaeota archaeon]
MEESEKQNLYITFKGVIESIIDDKRKRQKNLKTLNNFEAKINLGLQIEKDYYFWVNLVAKDGEYTFNRGKLDDYDLILKAAPEDLMYFSNGEYSTIHMMLKKNRFGDRKLRTEKGSDGKRHLGILLKLPKILVLDKIEPQEN